MLTADEKSVIAGEQTKEAIPPDIMRMALVLARVLGVPMAGIVITAAQAHADLYSYWDQPAASKVGDVIPPVKL